MDGEGVHGTRGRAGSKMFFAHSANVIRIAYPGMRAKWAEIVAIPYWPAVRAMIVTAVVCSVVGAWIEGAISTRVLAVCRANS